MADNNKDVLAAISSLSSEIKIDRFRNSQIAKKLHETSHKLDLTCDNFNIIMHGKENQIGIKAKVSKIEDTQKRWVKYFTLGIVAVIGLIANSIKDIFK